MWLIVNENTSISLSLSLSLSLSVRCNGGLDVQATIYNTPPNKLSKQKHYLYLTRSQQVIA